MAFINSRLPRSAKLTIAGALLLVVFVYTSFFFELPSLSEISSSYEGVRNSYSSQAIPKISTFQSDRGPLTPLPNSPEAHDFWREFAKLLKEGSVDEIVKTLAMPDEDLVGWSVFDGIQKGAQQPDRLKMEPSVVAAMKKKHTLVADGIRRIAGQLPYKPGTRGIVTTAGPTAEAILSTSIRMLRASGSQLPVEIWLYNVTDHDSYMCEHVWKPLDATCMVMLDYLPEDVWPTGTTPLDITQHFQMKMLSIMFSTFEHAFFMDCDLFPINNPDSIFVTEPFISKGWVLWPDYWANTNSKFYGEIVDRPQADMYTRQSTESGAMIINKATHSPAMLLAAYYNRYGPNHYYWLFSQGGAGHGDKDTYLPAIEYFNFPFYQVDSTARRVGYRCNGNERAIGSGQAHPRDDWIITSQNLSRSHGNLLGDIPVPRLLFIHNNLPKMDPVSLMIWYIPNEWMDQTRCDAGVGAAHRQWGTKQQTMWNYGWDAEKALWDQMRWLACEVGDNVKRWREGLNVDCSPKAVQNMWCPASKIGTMYQFQPPEHDICIRFTELYEEVFPDEVYDPSLPARPELPWTALAGGIPA